jgi:hypothetical protein
MKKTYYIGELKFNTKEQCKNYTRNIINNLGCCVINKHHTHFRFFENLLQNHPDCNDKKGIGIDYFYIRHNSLNKKCYHTMIKRSDGSEIDFSWNHCCDFKERTQNEYLVKSMRNAIKDYAINYKQQQGNLICNFCKTENELFADYHVDHHNPSFKILKDTFLQLTKKQIPTVFGECEKNLTIFKDEDEDFKNDWVDYHNVNCNFQILCKYCNLRKNKL